ncbi:NAD-glutamate dehydrogenase [Auraticoccus monumenti]|uniref:Glutamate dehydrogenase (NAD) n=1 Tax=Auraticoccus monumenti TaxID=675864 RepID=A0A1G7AIP1_9ACTN|nr:NAD-glutamate dehydrogenase [Auraticoccus monumenti]SDE13746.1 glutamate dehydrogenase (NAD) [Auraticoccus monumenti]
MSTETASTPAGPSATPADPDPTDLKQDRIAELARRGAELAGAMGQDQGRAEEFLQHYFRHVDADEVLLQRDPDDVFGLVVDHFRLASTRTGADPVVRAGTPTRADGGWAAPEGASVLQLVNLDRPFLVDSVTMEIARQGWVIRELFHPQFWVVRDDQGRLQSVLHARQAAEDTRSVAESWIHVEVVPAGSRPVREEDLQQLVEGLTQVLEDVRVVVEDFGAMRERVLAACEDLADREMPVTEEERTSAIDLLRWLAEGHFTFLGYRDYELVVGDAVRRYEPVPGTGLGILRDDTDVPGRFHANPPTAERPMLVVVTKDNLRSRVHRPAYLDYVGVRLFDATGRVVGERRFLGLFAHSAYTEPVTRVPVLASKAAEVLARTGYAADSHGGKSVMRVLSSYPRDEMFQTNVPELAPIVEEIARLRERRQVRVFARRDPYGRYLSCLVYFPRDRYTTEVRLRIESVLQRALGAESVEYQAQVSESVLARLHLVARMPAGRRLGAYDVPALERELTDATRSWNDLLRDQLAQHPDLPPVPELERIFPEGYKEDYEPRQGVLDLAALLALDDAPDEADADAPTRSMAQAIYVPDAEDDPADLRLKVFRTTPMPLSQVLPHLSAFGIDVLDERPYELRLPGGRRAYVLDFGLRVPGGVAALDERWRARDRDRFTDAFAAVHSGRMESDALNRLVLAAGLTWRQVSWLRAVARYLRQAGISFSQTYISTALVANVDLARLLVRLFEVRFAPRDEACTPPDESAVESVLDRIRAGLDDVASLDQDRILRAFLAVVMAMVRTNAFQPGRAALAFKLLPTRLPDLPAPRPAFEIFVCSPRVEGVHLRFGAVARGGLRWSDRPEDFRTEVLGLVKAQMVKNTVIVPVGAKGGFYCRQLPDPGDRQAWLAEGQACYRLFISSLLDVTDNIVVGEVVPPQRVVRHDPDDPYLVVAADKGTATFSDLANAISLERGFWLGDAFASGGSVGYDHKGMGITARGAWESVRRHFREMGVDCQREDVTVVGVGDMSGDVFGNGMLLSEHIRLVAAFDHRHVFLDPDPDAATSFAERRRLFGLPRSSWADYDPSLLSEGGGVFPRTAKSIPVHPRVRERLGLDEGVTALAPHDLLSAILRAPVDLLWNGGIGTYVKAAAETSAEVGDKANDAIRVDGAQLRARCVGEGGNLGLTQRGRIEYAAGGGRINTDFIDNSAGVDTSDHEVNIKILLAGEIAAGRLAPEEREPLLASMTDDVAALVLEHNYDQNLALANGLQQSTSMAPVHEAWMQQLTRVGLLDRTIENLPGTEEMTARIAAGRGLTSPELATLLSYTKIWLEEEILATDLPDDPFLADRLVQYFPQALREGHRQGMSEHRLHREIITTVAVNRFVNSAGITAVHRLGEDTQATAQDVMRAQLAARSIVSAGRHEVRLRQLDHVVDAGLQTRLRLELRTVVERSTRWVLSNRRSPIDIQAVIEQFADGVGRISQAMPQLLTGREGARFADRLSELDALGIGDELATTIAGLPFLQGALSVVQAAQQAGQDPVVVARVHHQLSELLGLDRLQQRVAALPRTDPWDALARNALRDELGVVHTQLTSEVLRHLPDEGGGDEVAVALERWGAETPGLEPTTRSLAEICAEEPTLARMSVGLRMVRTLLAALG